MKNPVSCLCESASARNKPTRGFIHSRFIAFVIKPRARYSWGLVLDRLVNVGFMMGDGLGEGLLGSETSGTESLPWRIWDEAMRIWRISFPAILSRLSLFGVIILTQAFIGHISNLDYAAFAVVQTILVRFVSGVTVSIVHPKLTTTGNRSAKLISRHSYHCS